MRRLFDFKMNNRGSALLTVILMVGFLTILATTLLYISGMNFQIKQADYQNKKNFYTGETALETIRARLMEDAADAAAEAYNDVSMRYITLENKEMRELEYNKAFVARLQERWDETDRLQDPSVGGDWQNLLERYTPGYVLRLDAAYDASGNRVTAPSATVLTVNEAAGNIRIKGLKVSYVDPQTKRTTIISTDLDVNAPAIDWSAAASSTDLAEGTTAEDAAKKTTVDAATCVKYANWKKE